MQLIIHIVIMSIVQDHVMKFTILEKDFSTFGGEIGKQLKH